jgi:predicted nucleic acid-binding protein
MALTLIDSDVLIDFVRGLPGVASFIQQLQAGGDAMCTCDVVIAEVEAGLSATLSSAAQPILENLVFLERDAAAARQAGRWRYDYARKGIALSLPDAMIAATAHAHGARLLTRNLSHYPMPELTILPGPLQPPRR